MFYKNYTSDILEDIKNKNKEKDKNKSEEENKEKIKEKNGSLSLSLSAGKFKIFLPKSFGFCFGVRNALKIVSDVVSKNKGKNIYLLSEIIHNENVNSDLIKGGVNFIFGRNGEQRIPFDKLKKDDICIIPAFGATREIKDILNQKFEKNNIYDTCCPFVKKVLEAAKNIGKSGGTIVIHGKYNHEETRAAFSFARQYGEVIVIKDILEATFLADCIKGKFSKKDFYNKFKDVITKDFDFEKHLKKMGIVNQTTMLANDTVLITNIIKDALSKVKGEFVDVGFTLCYATTKNQKAVKALVKEKLDIVLVVGGFNSSNTTNLYKIAKQNFERTYFIKDEKSIISDTKIVCFDVENKKENIKENYLSSVKNIGIIAGASCPDILIENVIKKLASFS